MSPLPMTALHRRNRTVRKQVVMRDTPWPYLILLLWVLHLLLLPLTWATLDDNHAHLQVAKAPLAATVTCGQALHSDVLQRLTTHHVNPMATAVETSPRKHPHDHALSWLIRGDSHRTTRFIGLGAESRRRGPPIL